MTRSTRYLIATCICLSPTFVVAVVLIVGLYGLLAQGADSPAFAWMLTVAETRSFVWLTLTAAVMAVLSVAIPFLAIFDPKYQNPTSNPETSNG